MPRYECYWVMPLHSVKELKNIHGKRVLVRVDFNVPLAKSAVHSAQFTVGDGTKIKAAVSTIELLIKKGAKVILMTHFGRSQSKGSGIRGQGLGVVVEKLSELLKKKVQTIEKWDFEEIHATVKKMKAGDVLMLPNVRLHPGEEKNSPAFAKNLASLGDYYVNEAFPECHRKYASMVGVPKHLPGYAGLRLIEEMAVLSQVLEVPAHPCIALMGGGKITDKIAMMKSMLTRADLVLAGGALATHFFKAMGYDVGASRIESEGVRLAKELLGNHRHGHRLGGASGASKKIILPKDVVVGTLDGERAWVEEIADLSFPRKRESMDPRSRSGMTLSRVICDKPYAILDIGPKTILEYAGHIKNARTLVWNGPMGLYEIKRYSHGTIALGRLFAARSKGKAFGVIGGGETIDAVRQTGMIEYVDFVSTGGGAMLEYLGGKKLPGIEALKMSPS